VVHRVSGCKYLAELICFAKSAKSRLQWLKGHWTQGNAVPVPLVIEIERSHTSNFIKMLGDPRPPVVEPKTGVQFPHL